MKKYIAIVSGLMIAATFTGCQTMGQFTGNTPVERTGGDMGLGEYKGLKHAVGVIDFDNQAGWRGQWELGNNLSTMLESALFDTGRFVLVDRQNLQRTIQEQDLAASGRTAGARQVAQTGVIRPARYIATGTITTVDDATSGGGGGIGYGGVRIGGSMKKSTITIIAKLVDTSTGEIVAQERITGSPGGIGLSLGLNRAGFSGALGGFTKTPLGEAAQDCINQAAKFFAKQMESFPFEGSVIRVTDRGQAIINRGSEFGVSVGQELVLLEEGEVLIDPDTGALLGKEEGDEIARVRIARVQEKVSYADIISGDKNPPVGTQVRLK
ncbi:MAG TPA: CsgG/HfaB family protein [Kiritimatiellia bacterium]|nr:CsgG/HfaB family protein [Kiritimatiellia bacterium]